MARPRNFVEAEVVKRAAAVFALNGYSGTTMDALADATGLGKQSIYNSFGGKFALYLRALEGDAAHALADVTEALDDQHGTPIQKIHAHIMMSAIAASAQGGRSTLFAKGTMELSERYNEVAGAASRTFGELQRMYADCFADAQACGELDPDADTEALGLMFLAYFRGLQALGAATFDKTRIVDSAVTAFDLLPLTDLGRRVAAGELETAAR